MKRWALVVTFLYFLIIVGLTLPVVIIAFWPHINVRAEDLGDLFSTSAWPYWVFVAVLVFSQVALLTVPVGLASRRPIKRRSLLLPILVSGLMMGSMVIGAVFSLHEFIARDIGPSSWMALGALALGGLTWVMWTVVFYRLSRNENPADVISRQCRFLLKGSILELLIAVPTHIVARSRDYCCAGFMTFIGIALGISVMLLSYGPGVFFLFLDRWNRLYQRRKSDDDLTSSLQDKK